MKGVHARPASVACRRAKDKTVYQRQYSSNNAYYYSRSASSNN